jgi:hypothetical protein
VVKIFLFLWGEVAVGGLSNMGKGLPGTSRLGTDLSDLQLLKIRSAVLEGRLQHDGPEVLSVGLDDAAHLKVPESLQRIEKEGSEKRARGSIQTGLRPGADPVSSRRQTRDEIWGSSHLMAVKLHPGV